MSLSLNVKRLFLSFLQEYYSTHLRYTWTEDPRFTDIVIADKYAVDLGVAAKRPSIILDRGSIGLTNTFRNEAHPISNRPYKDSVDDVKHVTLGDKSTKSYSLTDLIASSVTFNIMSKSPAVADELANEMFILLIAFREDFKAKGIHKYNSLQISRESVGRVNSAEIELSTVSVSLSFFQVLTVLSVIENFNSIIYLEGKPLKENGDYKISIDGDEVEFLFDVAPEKDVKISYVDAITTQFIEDVPLIHVEGRKWVLSDGGKIYGYFKIFKDFIVEHVEEEETPQT